MRHVWLVVTVFLVLLLFFKIKTEFHRIVPSAAQKQSVPAEPAEELLLSIIRSWNFENFEPLIHPDVKQRIPREGLHSLFQGVAARLGPLRTYRYLSAPEKTWLASLGFGELIYAFDGDFMRGPARIEVRLVRQEGRYWIREFAVQSAAVEKVQQAAEKAYREGSFDAGLFYYELAVS